VQPGPGVWAGWASVLVGSLLVLAAAVLALTDPCSSHGAAPLSVACATSVTGTLAVRLAVGGTLLAGSGVVAATLLTIRRVGRARALGSSIELPDGLR
jgi:hypothetical protein